jgi:MYND finger
VQVPSAETQKDVGQDISPCDHCGLTAEQAGKSLKACAKCYDVHYCGKECQLAAWPGHKAACKARGKKRADELAARVSLGALPTR